MIMQKDFVSITGEKYQKAIGDVKPYIVGYNFTMACNLRCKWCVTGAGEPLEDEMSTKEALRVIDNLAEAGTIHLSFGGGEATVREDLFEVAKYASNVINSVGIVSNGYLIDERLAYHLAGAGVSSVMISLDGSEAQLHDQNRGGGSYDQAIKAIGACKKNNLATRVSFTISKSNYHDLENMVELAKKLAIPLNVQEFMPRGRGRGKENLVLTKEQRKEMQLYLRKTQKKYGNHSVGFEDRYIVSADEEIQNICADTSRECDMYNFNVGCLTGIYSVFLNADGKISLCGKYGLGVLGDLKKHRLAEIWKNSDLLQYIRNRDNLGGICGKCHYRFICGGCRAVALHEKGDFMEEDPRCWVKRCKND